MKAIGFSIEGVLVEGDGGRSVPDVVLGDALARVIAVAGIPPEQAKLAAGRAILRRFDPAVRPREFEVTFAHILEDLELCFLRPFIGSELKFAHAFFPVVRGPVRLHPDALPCLERLGREHLLGVCTDVPFGMPRELVMGDLHDAGLGGVVSAIVTSRDTGFRKPSKLLLESLAADMKCKPADFTYVGASGGDIRAALAFGCRAVLVDRPGHGADFGQHRTLRSLSEL